MKIIVIGSKGMLGTDLVYELKKNKSNIIVALDINEVDITKEESLQKIVLEKADFVINCAAYTNVDLAETNKEKCFAINVTGVKNLVKTCKNMGSTLIHISTDYVFDGKKEGYDELDKKNPINYYGLTKSLGEDELIKNTDKYYLVRTSWLFGKNGKNFIEIIKSISQNKSSIKVVTDQTARPTYTIDLAKQIIYLIENKTPFGIYHITNSGKCSRFLFAKEIINLLKLNCVVEPCATNEFPSAAKRPTFSVLNNNKLPQLRKWEIALAEYLGVD
ncbi:MAG: dTDP-4-dehydrorhamnose reductase [archaeon]